MTGVQTCALPISNFGTETITIFPNISIQPLANGYLFYQFWPLSHDKMRTEVRIYGRHAPKNLREEFAMAHTLAATRDAVAEDMAMSRLQQIGLKSGGKKVQNFGARSGERRVGIEGVRTGRSRRWQ